MIVDEREYDLLIRWASDREYPVLQYQVTHTVGEGLRAWGAFLATASDEEIAAAIAAVRKRDLED